MAAVAAVAKRKPGRTVLHQLTFKGRKPYNIPLLSVLVVVVVVVVAGERKRKKESLVYKMYKYI